MNTNAIGPNSPSDDELLATVRRRMASVEPLVPQPPAWRMGERGTAPVRARVRTRFSFGGLAPLILVIALVATAVGLAVGSRWASPASNGPSDGIATLTYQLTTPDGGLPSAADLDETVRVLSNRLRSCFPVAAAPVFVTAPVFDASASPLAPSSGAGASLSVAPLDPGFSVTPQPPDRIIVRLQAGSRMISGDSNIWDYESIKALLGKTGKMELVDLPADVYGTKDVAGMKPVPSPFATIDPALHAIVSDSEIDRSQLTTTVGSDPTAGLVLGFTAAGLQAITDYSAGNVGHYLAVVIDGVVYETITVADPASSGPLLDNGRLFVALVGMSDIDAYRLTVLLDHGSLPVLMHVTYESGPPVVADPTGPRATPTSMGTMTLFTPSVSIDPAIPSSGRTLGNPNAPVTMDVWVDFQCSACAGFANGTERQLIDNYVKQGKLRIVYHDLIVIDQATGGQGSADAAAAARIAAERGKFWAYADLLWANQSPTEAAGSFSWDRLIEFARMAGLDTDQFLADMQQGKYAAEVSAESASAQTAGFTGAPTILVNGTAVGDRGMVPDYAAISAVIDGQLASPSPVPTN
ncbi:MAG TPA: thioredoxin domain-containing protein [Candidatus Limnocylindrales bacterium]